MRANTFRPGLMLALVLCAGTFAQSPTNVAG